MINETEKLDLMTIASSAIVGLIGLMAIGYVLFKWWAA